MSLKGWWGRSGETESSSGMQHWQPPFPRLSTLIIDECPKLTFFPPCPSLKLLTLRCSNTSLRILPGQPIYEALIEKLQPNLMELTLWGYNGSEIPRWGRAHDDWAFIFPNLVNIELKCCRRLHGIPLLSNLRHLKFLCLHQLDSLEYVEIDGSSGSKDVPFFPSLEYLSISGANNLKGWREGVGESDGSSKSHWLPPFPCLLTLKIAGCPELTHFPPCPSLESFEVTHSRNLLLGISPGEGHGNFDINNYSSLRNIKIKGWTMLTNFLGVLEHATALESLSLLHNHAKVDMDDIPWRSLGRNLRSLELKEFIPTHITLPMGMRHLTALENLDIGFYPSLKGLPEWISCLSSLQSLTIIDCPDFISLGTIQNITSLQKLQIEDCPKLKEACQEPSGTEWSKIQHIPIRRFLDTPPMDSSDTE